MSKSIDHGSMDAALNDIKTNATKLHVVSAAPASYADVATYALGFVALASGDFTLQAGVVSGRRLTVAQKTVAGTGAGSGTHIVIIDETHTTIKAVDSLTTPFTMANGVNVVNPAYDCWEIEDPT